MGWYLPAMLESAQLLPEKKRLAYSHIYLESSQTFATPTTIGLISLDHPFSYTVLVCDRPRYHQTVYRLTSPGLVRRNSPSIWDGRLGALNLRPSMWTYNLSGCCSRLVDGCRISCHHTADQYIRYWGFPGKNSTGLLLSSAQRFWLLPELTSSRT